MSSWTHGYVADVEYTHGFYRELTPELLRFSALVNRNRISSPGRPLTYCELGCGQGFTANLLAAANPHIQFYANDFNPTQIANARLLAEDSNLDNVLFYDNSFEDFADEASLPDEFDVIALHGIYSWISPENRQHIINFIRKKLKVGGLVYASYNTMPGWAPVIPLRRILQQQYKKGTVSAEANVKQAIEFVKEIENLDAFYFRANSALNGRVEILENSNVNYIANEYLNSHWTPFFFDDVAKEFQEAKLTFVASAELLDTVSALNFTPQQQEFLNNIDDVISREAVKDVLVNRAFRKDIYIKGPLSYDLEAWQQAWLDTRFFLVAAPDTISLTMKRRLGEVKLAPEIYGPLIDVFASTASTLRQVVNDPRIVGLGWQNLVQALVVLVGMGHLQPCLSSKDDSKRKDRVRAFNAAVCARALYSENLKAVASSVTGGGVAVDRITQIFICATLRNEKDPVSFAWSALDRLGHRIMKGNLNLETPEENITELKVRYENFVQISLPRLKSYGVI